ncbi:MAG: hypothetical protein ABSE63_02580 [Thermoguttaceae bacterium]|jgi:hypothetical protein
MILGIFISQPILFALWASFAPQRFYQRFLWSFLLCTLVSFAEELGSFRYANSEHGSIMLIFSALFVVATIILLIIRRLTRWQMMQSFEANVYTDYPANQFGIKHLIILTTITAIACGLFRTASPNLKGLPSVAEFFGAVCLLLMLSYPIIAVPWYILAYRGKIIPIVLFTVSTWIILDLAAFLILDKTFPTGITIYEILKPVLFFQIGAVLSSFVSTFVIRLCGFRMIRMPKAATEQGKSSMPDISSVL